MSELLLYKASAGSGKTYQLTRQYLEVLFREEKNYSAILAVTFTNKAATELKDRILDELIKIGSGKLEKSDHFEYLADVLKRPEDLLIKRANKILSLILEDYSRFSIGTIDEFFQTILRSFARDLGISSAYQVELNADRLIEEAIESLIVKASIDAELFSWMQDGISEKIEEGQAWRKFQKELFKLGSEILKEKLAPVVINPDKDIFSQQKIKDLRKLLFSRRSSFKKRLDEISNEVSDVLLKENFEFSDFIGKGSGPVAFLINLRNEKYEIGAKRKYVDESQAWLAKNTGKLDVPRANKMVDVFLRPLFVKVLDIIDLEYPIIKLSEKLNKELSRLGLMSALASEMIDISKEKDLFLISFTNPIIAKLVRDNPAPFIYERTGHYFKHYMIDEFQDTSTLQWNNFLPLIKESLAAGGYNMLVGDPKQSIYRWRNSNWKLIDSLVASDLASFKINNQTLDKNFRSREAIIDFNNQLFSRAGQKVADQLRIELKGVDSIAGQQINSIENVYEDVKQTFGKSRKGGLVRVLFTPKDDYLSFPSHFDLLPEIIEDFQINRGYTPGDIVFLVRKNDEASEIIRYFMAFKTSAKARSGCVYDAVSAESLRLDSSPVIRTIVAYFELENSPDDRSLLNRFALEYISSRSDKFDQTRIVSLAHANPAELFEYLEIKNFDSFVERTNKLGFAEKIEFLITTFRFNQLAGELPFILSFKENFYDEFNDSGDPTLKDFLNWWIDIGSAKLVPMNENVNAMRVMSIHKAKGLEFPVVILTNCAWTFDHHSSNAPILWMDTSGTPFDSVPILPFKYGKDLLGSPFEQQYVDEKSQTYLDNLNLMYVALTRAIDHLYVFVPRKEKHRGFGVGDILETIVAPDESNYYEFGDSETAKIHFAEKQGEASNNFYYPAKREFEKIANDSRKSPELKRGSVLHRMLERIITINDLDQVIDEMYDSGEIGKESGESFKRQITNFISRPELIDFFTGSGEVFNERSFLVPGQGEYRADRVIVYDDRVVVLEYKTGHIEGRHQEQLKRYLSGLKKMGYQEVEGYLLYIDENEVIRL